MDNVLLNVYCYGHALCYMFRPFWVIIRELLVVHKTAILHSFSSLSYDRSVASSKANSPLGAI
jgi:hypothetical protein